MKAQVLEKHKRYGKAYGKNELFWGLGIECESYFEMEKPQDISANFIANNHKRERYSVDYYTSYKQDLLKNTFSVFQDKNDTIYLPLLLNSHFFTKLDTQLQHKTLYSKNTPQNPNFAGKTIFELLKEYDADFFDKGYDETYTFDGDSVEIMTQNFYKATVDSAINELLGKQYLWIEKLRTFFKEHEILTKFGHPSWIKGNHGFAIMATNPNQLAIFNNGTYHINITLPTQLNEKSEIANWQTFVKQHQAYIRCIQWMEPLLIANFGSPDPLAWIDSHFSNCSQRAAMSRYIGLGTYNTDIMKEGKVLTVDLSEVSSTWYSTYHKTSGYTPLDKVGLDINFHKHWNHGIEIRFFDWFPQSRLAGLLRFLIYLADVSLEFGCELNPINNPIWNAWMVRVMQKGAEAGCTMDESRLIEKIFHIYVSPTSHLHKFFAEMYNKLNKKYMNKGKCSSYFFHKELCENQNKEKSTCCSSTIQLGKEESPKKSRCY